MPNLDILDCLCWNYSYITGQHDDSSSLCWSLFLSIPPLVTQLSSATGGFPAHSNKSASATLLTKSPQPQLGTHLGNVNANVFLSTATTATSTHETENNHGMGHGNTSLASLSTMMKWPKTVCGGNFNDTQSAQILP